MSPPPAARAPPTSSRSTAPATPRSTRWPASTSTFEHGRFTAVMGPSGSGKSTLMHCMAGLDAPTSGQTWVGDEEIGLLDDAGLTQLRRDRIGFVFQSFNLVPTLTAEENITLPSDLAGTQGRPGVVRLPGRRARDRGPAVAPPQRDVRRPAAACRLRPGADQPAGPGLRRRAHGQPRLELLGRDARRSCAARSTELEQSIVMVTHDPRGAAYADRVVFLADGKVVGELLAPDGRLGARAHAKLGD